MNRNEYLSRRKKVISQLPEGSVLLMFSGEELRKTADEMYPFFANRNFFYLTGITQCRSALLILNNGGCVTERIYALPKDEDGEVRTGRRYTEGELTEISGVVSVSNIGLLENDLHQIFSGCKYRILFLCIDMLEPFRHTGIERFWMKRVNKAYPQIKLENIFPIIAGMRRYKSPDEVLAIRSAMNITGAGIARAMHFCKPVVMEYQIEAEFLHELAMTGQRSPAFPPIIAAGEQIFYLHYSSPVQKVLDGDLVLTDVGAAFDQYNTDVSRVFPANGKFTEKQAEIYLIALEANRAIIQDVRPGRDFAITNEICKKVVFQGLKCLGLISDFKDISRFVWHKTTHHVGLDTHDVGGYEDPMAEGMVFTVDAGIYVREWGIGLRIEDDVLVTSNGCENLSAEIPVEICDIEAQMAH